MKGKKFTADEVVQVPFIQIKHLQDTEPFKVSDEAGKLGGGVPNPQHADFISSKDNPAEDPRVRGEADPEQVGAVLGTELEPLVEVCEYPVVPALTQQPRLHQLPRGKEGEDPVQGLEVVNYSLQ